jgi:Domain of unknown function (DUF4406)
MKHIYIAGQYRGPSAWVVERHVREAEQLALVVASIGAVAICPHTMSRYFEGTLSDSYWLAASMSMLERCDAVLTVPLWGLSAGARAEVKRATKLPIPVFHDPAKLSLWLREVGL